MTIKKRPIPTRERKVYTLRDGRKVRGCRELGCYRATLGPFCTECVKEVRR